MNSETYCENIIPFSAYYGAKFDKSLRRDVLRCKCPACGKEKRLVKNWFGPIPPGGVRCNPTPVKNIPE